MLNIVRRESLPRLDLHGENRDSARILVNEFLEYNYKMGNLELMIIHGKGEGILKKEVHNVLKNNKKVVEYGLDMFNEGCTLVRLVSYSIDKNGHMCYDMQHNVKGGY